MCANIGVIIGPMIGGITSNPVASYPSLFGGIAWLEKYPYSPPQVISACILCTAAVAVFFGLEEVSLSPTIRHFHKHALLRILYCYFTIPLDFLMSQIPRRGGEWSGQAES